MLVTFAIIVIAVIFAFMMLQFYAANRARRLAGTPLAPYVVKKLSIPKNRPALLYFTSPSCSMCRIQEEEMGNWKPESARFLKVNIAENLDIARELNIMGTPSFILVDGKSMIREVLIGRQRMDKLNAIVQNLAAA